MGPEILLAMEAAGMIVDYIGTQNQLETARQGAQLEQAGIEANLQITRLESANASLEAMKKLRQNIGTQAVIFAGRGTRAGAGSAALASQTSISNFNADERSRRMNLLARESQLRAGKILSGMHQLTSETQLGQSLTNRFFEKLPTDPEVWEKGINKAKKSFGMTQLS
jgi:hypothetical protein